MLIKFKSEQSADFVMLADIAIPLLELMGTGAGNEGAVSGQALRDALGKLESGLKQQPSAEPAETDEDDEEQEPEIALSVRAAPLLAMLHKAAAEDGYVMWQED